MTDSITKPDTTTESKPKTEPERVSLSFTQLLASVLAAVSASLAASVFGVAGTLIGAALGSAISVLGGFVYARSLERSRQAVRLTLDVAAARRPGGRAPAGPDGGLPDRGSPDRGSPDRTGSPAGRGHRLRVALTPKRLALGAGALFVLTMGLITGFELLTGQPVAASVDGRHGSGVSVLGGTEKKSTSSPKPAGTAPSTTAPSTAGSVPSGTSVPTPTVTVTVTPSATPSATQSTVPPSGSSAPTAPSSTGGGSPAGSSAGTPGGG